MLDLREYTIPATYTLENKMLSVFLQEFALSNMFDSADEAGLIRLQKELSVALFRHFRYAFTKADISSVNGKVKIEIEYTGGLPLTVEILNNTTTNEN